jgi:putative hemolysin
MDLLSLTILLFVLFLFRFVLGVTESVLCALLKNERDGRLAKREHSQTHLYSIGQANSSLDLIASLLNASITTICIVMLIEATKLYFMLFYSILLSLVVILCVFVQKILASKYHEAWAACMAKPVLLILWLAKPLGAISEFICEKIIHILIPKKFETDDVTSDEEFSELIDMAYQQGVIERSEREILNEIIKLDQKTAEEVMKPRSDMICIEDTSDLNIMISFSKKHNHTRIPIYNETPDNVVGILNTRKLLLSPNEDVSEAIEFPSFVPSTMNLMNLLQSLQKQRRGLAIVLDEFGGTAGLITIEDILEELVGEMREEGEQIEFTVEKLHWNRWRVNGALPIEDFQKVVPELKAVPEVDTMGGLVAALNEVVPKTGESLKYCALELTVVSADERRVKELIVKRLTK